MEATIEQLREEFDEKTMLNQINDIGRGGWY